MSCFLFFKSTHAVHNKIYVRCTPGKSVIPINGDVKTNIKQSLISVSLMASLAIIRRGIIGS